MLYFFQYIYCSGCFFCDKDSNVTAKLTYCILIPRPSGDCAHWPNWETTVCCPSLYGRWPARTLTALSGVHRRPGRMTAPRACSGETMQTTIWVWQWVMAAAPRVGSLLAGNMGPVCTTFRIWCAGVLGCRRCADVFLYRPGWRFGLGGS